VQTFRREKRIAKRPKRYGETLKSAKHSKCLSKSLTTDLVQNIICDLLQGEFLCSDNSNMKMQPEPNICEKDPTTVASHYANISDSQQKDDEKSGMFSKVYSANDVRVPPVKVPPIRVLPRKFYDADGTQFPEERQIFTVYPETNPDEEYKGKVDYQDPVLLRVKTKTMIDQKLPSMASVLELYNSVPFLPRKTVDFTSLKPIFNFSIYKEDIYYSPFERYDNRI